MNRSFWSSLRSRLIASYVGLLVLALAAFGAIAVVVIDRDLHASLDARLRTTSQAALNFVDVSHATIAVDERDRAQLFALLGSQIDIAVLSDAKGVVLSTTPLPPQLAAHARGSEGLATLTLGGDEVRVLVLPIVSGGRRAGTVMGWASTEWIEVTDRQVAIAFAVAALLLAAVASWAGSSLARRALEDTFQRQRRFTTDAAHELRAPLSVIRAEADLALSKPRDAPVYQAALATIASETEQMEALVSSLLVAARAQEGRASRAVVEPLTIARGVCARLRSSADVKRISVDAAQGDGCAVLCDGDALERAITAVLHNAIKNTPQGGSIRVWAERRSGACELNVRDSGPGFSADALAHGLEWFWRGDPGRVNGQATGLGLAIASSIAAANGGGVRLANAPDGGALVTISLPCRQ